MVAAVQNAVTARGTAREVDVVGRAVGQNPESGRSGGSPLFAQQFTA
jgi:hypothetical protein